MFYDAFMAFRKLALRGEEAGKNQTNAAQSKGKETLFGI